MVTVVCHTMVPIEKQDCLVIHGSYYLFNNLLCFDHLSLYLWVTHKEGMACMVNAD
jgi:hypothetical protein